MIFLSEFVKDQKAITVPKEMTVSDAAKAMCDGRVGSALVTENGRLIGIVTERDFMKKVVAEGKDPKVVIIKDVMTTDVKTVDASATIESCFQPMKDYKCRHLPVLKEGKLVGIISIRDVLENLVDLLKFERDQLKQYIQS